MKVRLTRVLASAGVVWLCTQLWRYYAASGLARHHVESASFIAAAAILLLLLALPSMRSRYSQPPAALAHFSRQRVTVLLLFCAGAFALYAPALTVGLLSDDFVLVERASRSALFGHAFVRPVPLLVWHGMLGLGGGAVAFHALNVLLHGVNAALTTALCVRAGVRGWPAVLAGVLFLVWPTQVEPVVWGAALPDVLMTTLVLTVVVAWVAGAWNTRSGATAVAFLTIVALLTKETACVLPALMIVITLPYWRDARPRPREVWALSGLMLACGAYLVWRLFIRVSPAEAIHPAVSRYVLKEMLSRTFAGLGVPLPVEAIQANAVLALLYGFGALSLVTVPILLSRVRRTDHRAIVQGLVWTIIAALPATGYLFIGSYLEGSRYLYLAAAGWCVALAAGVEGCRNLGRSAGVTAAAAAIVLASASVVQTQGNIRDWTRAAAVRDELLARASAFAEREHCGTLRATGLPETVRGAQVFRNGFAEAMRAIRQNRSRTICDVMWDGTQFRRAPSGRR